jgi:hypothetical protein
MRQKRISMRAKTVFSLIFIGILALASAVRTDAATAAQTKSAGSAPSAQYARDVLDQKRIHSDYNEGNFERVVSTLEGFMSRNKTYSLEDSIFIAKHLAVVYSANPETREKGKYYMFRLLAMVPSAKLIDMFVSDEIDRIFDKVREEFLARQKSFGVDSTQMSLPAKSPVNQSATATAAAADKTDAAQDPAPRPVGRESDGGSRRKAKPIFFVAGGAAIVAVGVTAYLMMSDSPKQTEKTYDIP